MGGRGVYRGGCWAGRGVRREAQWQHVQAQGAGVKGRLRGRGARPGLTTSGPARRCVLGVSEALCHDSSPAHYSQGNTLVCLLFQDMCCLRSSLTFRLLGSLLLHHPGLL